MARQTNRTSRSGKERRFLPTFLAGGVAGALVALGAVHVFAPQVTPAPLGSEPPDGAAGEPFRYEFLERLRQGVPPRIERQPAPAPAAAGPEQVSTEYLLQAGSFPREEDADQMRALVTLVGGFEAYDGVSLSTTPVTLPGEGTWYRVLVGPFPDKASVQDAVERLRSQDIPALVLERPGG